MTGYIIDRRQNGQGKSIPNRARFMARVKNRVAEQVKNMINKGKIGDIFEDTKKINIPVGDLSEPNPVYDHHGGVTDLVVSGNKHYRVGDLIPKDPPQGRGNGSGGASNGGEGEDAFGFTLTRDEFIEYFFEDLELPNLINTDIAVSETFRTRKAGYSSEGSPSNLSILRTMKEATGRRMALRAEKKRKLKELEEELAKHIQMGSSADIIAALQADVEEARKKVKKVPYIDDIDLRYRNTIVEPVPTTQAVMFCLMDVSGSMSQWHKDIAKRFYMLLFLFLHKRYEKVDIVFVRHHTTAAEVDEQEFFYGRETGGTIVSSGMQLVADIIKERYDRQRWNVYVAQASDGDNWGDDEGKVLDLMRNTLLPQLQYFFYIEVSQGGREGDLWHSYKSLADCKNFDAQMVTDVGEIYTVFRKMFGGEAA